MIVEKYPRMKGHKTIVLGLQGAGKTHYAKELVKHHNYTALVYSCHKHDFQGEPDNFIYYGYRKGRFIDEFDEFCQIAIKLAQAGEIDVVLIDEFDLIFKSNFDITPAYDDLNANHRHYGLGMIGLTRRQADIPTKTVESALCTVTFCSQGANVQRKFNSAYKGWGDLVTELKYKAYSCVVKYIGMPPVVFDRNGNQLEINKSGTRWTVKNERDPIHYPDGSPINGDDPDDDPDPHTGDMPELQSPPMDDDPRAD